MRNGLSEEIVGTMPTMQVGWHDGHPVVNGKKVRYTLSIYPLLCWKSIRVACGEGVWQGCL